MQEKKIDLIDLVVEILQHWRRIVAVMLIGGVLMGVRDYIKSVHSYQEEAKLNKIEVLERKLTDVQIENVNLALLYETNSKEQEKYYNDTVFMQLDPVQIFNSDVIFQICTNTLENTYNIKKVYEDILTSTDFYNYVKEQCGIEKTINELIILGNNEDRELENDTIKITVQYYDEITCNAMADAIVAYIQQQHSKLDTILGNHEIEMIFRSVGVVTSSDILNKQRKCLEYITKYRAKGVKLKTAFNAEQWDYYNYLHDESTITSNFIENEKYITHPSIRIKFVIIGMVMFAFIYVFIISMLYILSDKLRVTDDLQEFCGIPQLGVAVQGTKKKRIFNSIDERILKLQYRNCCRVTIEEASQLAAIAIRLETKKQKLNKVCLSGCNLTSTALDMCEKIKVQLEREDISVNILNNIRYNVKAMKILENVQGVVLVESAGQTSYTEIIKEKELLQGQNIKIIGGIIVESEYK